MSLKLVVSGPGLIGKRHAQLVVEHPNCQLSGVVGPPSVRNRSVAAELGVPLLPSIDAALGYDRVDGVIVSSPNESHFAQVVMCIDKNVPVLVEKPLTDDIVSALSLAQLVHKTGAKVLVGHHRTYSPRLKVAKQFIESDDFGKPVFFQGAALFCKPDDYFQAGTWRARLGGGVLLINMIHEVGVMRYLFGEVAEVFAFSSHDLRRFEVEDSVSIALRFVSGALGSFALSDAAASTKSWEQTTGENASYPLALQQSCYHLAGTNGAIDFPSMAATYYDSENPKSWWLPQAEIRLRAPIVDPLAAQLQHFLAMIRGESDPLVSAQDGYQNMLVLEAIRESATRGVPVRVDAN